MAEKVKVKSGQTLSSIAKANNTTVSALLDANPKLTTEAKYNDGRTLFSGTTIKIPDASPKGSSTAAATATGAATSTPVVTPLTTPAPSGGQFTGPIPVGATRTQQDPHLLPRHHQVGNLLAQYQSVQLEQKLVIQQQMAKQ